MPFLCFNSFNGSDSSKIKRKLYSLIHKILNDWTPASTLPPSLPIDLHKLFVLRSTLLSDHFTSQNFTNGDGTPG